MTFVFLHLFCHKSPAKIELLQALPKAASSLLPFQVLKDIGCLQLKEETEIGQLELPVVQNRLSRFLGPTARLSRLPQSYEAWEWEGFLDVPGTV